MAIYDYKKEGHVRIVPTKKDPDKKWYMHTYATHDNGATRIYDYQVADYTKKHMRFIDRFNIRKVGAAMLCSYAILSNAVQEPSEKKKWKYYKDV